MAKITKEIDIDINIEDHLDEVGDEVLIEELASRGYEIYNEDGRCVSDDEGEGHLSGLPYEYAIKRCFDSKELRKHLEDITGCGGYVSNDDLIDKLKDLL